MNPPLRYINHVFELDADTIPSEAPVSLEPEHSLDPKLRACISKFREELEKRPIMAKRVQVNLIANSDHVLRRAWSYVGYMFSAGPFRDAIIKFGVDPRKDPACAKYQTLWFQLPGETGYGRSKGVENIPSRLNGKLRTPRIRAKSKDSHIFDGETLYRDGKTWQICDITDPLLKGFIDNAPLRDECDVRIH
jgi:general transcription factor 3C polypeptide 5 (transcription factor C subunit 1)